MTPERIKELALANGFKLKDQSMGGMDLNSYVYDFANALLAEAEADKQWTSLTGELLESYQQNAPKELLLKDTMGCCSFGKYEYRQNGYPHGFIVNDRWIDARCIIEVMINP